MEKGKRGKMEKCNVGVIGYAGKKSPKAIFKTSPMGITEDINGKIAVANLYPTVRGPECKLHLVRRLVPLEHHQVGTLCRILVMTNFFRTF